jgi:peptidoglycan/LPS O-acetylase OafA/YrhL
MGDSRVHEPARAVHADRSAGHRRLGYLDGMRAAASLYVVVFHAVIGFPRGELTGAWRLLKRAAAFGHEAVAVFIVLSGYCLMLPIVRPERALVPFRASEFMLRRAFRILPPYYAAVALSLVLLAGIDVLGTPGTGTIWDDSLPGFGLAPIGSHLVLVHNWIPNLAFQINGPLWSVATEWQIYFFFPWLLLPMWRRFGAPAALLVSLVLGYAPLAWAPRAAHTAIPWYLALFCLGMSAAGLVHAGRPGERRLRERLPWGRLTFGLWAAAAVGGWLFGTVWFRSKPLTDLLLGFATATFLVYAGVRDGATHVSMAWLGSRPAVALGQMSYSLYLTHLPVVALCHFALVPLGLSAGVHALALLTFSVPLSLLVAHGFYLAVERRFVGRAASFRRRE